MNRVITEDTDLDHDEKELVNNSVCFVDGGPFCICCNETLKHAPLYVRRHVGAKSHLNRLKEWATTMDRHWNNMDNFPDWTDDEETETVQAILSFFLL